MNEQRNADTLADHCPAEAAPGLWVAPLQCVTIFSVAEFTEGGAFPPSDDGNGTWTQS